MEALVALFEAHGEEGYIGESVTQLEHALQAAEWARDAGEGRAMIMAALCHDVGHLLLLAGHDLSDMDGLGAHAHAVAGAEWLETELGLGKDVTDPVRLHVAAKRYQAHKVPRYAEEQLSEASRKTLALQGGPMDHVEARQFEAHPRFLDALRLRRYDNAAKERGRRTWGLGDVLAYCGY